MSLEKTRCMAVAALLTVSASPLVAQAPPMQRANRMFFQGKYDSAVAVLHEVLGSDSTNARAWSLLGAALQGANRLDEALDADRRAAQWPITRPTALYNIGLIFAARANPDSAFSYLLQARSLGANLADIDIDKDAEPLRKDPRYASLKPSAEEFAKPFAEPFRIIHEFRGSGVNDQFGWIARDIGDVDGDRIHDFVTSAPTRASGAGAVYVYSSKTGRELWHVDGQAGDAMGQGIEAAGDVNGDGIPDVIGSAPGRGAAWVWSGRDGRELLAFHAEKPSDVFGAHVDGLGDVNHDGHADLIVGAPGANGTGRAYIYSGRDGALLAMMSGTQQGERFGSAVSGRTTSGKSLILVGAPGGGARHTGELFVYKDLSGTPAFTFSSDSTGGALGGMFVSVPGDVDGDGNADVYVSDWQNAAHGPATGRTYVLSGVSGATLLTLTGETAGDGFGTSASVAGDANGDGHADLVVGAWRHAAKAVSGGKIYLYSGKDGQLLRTWTGQVPGEALGFDAVGIGDVDGDGAVDFLLTSAYSAISGSHSGRVFIVAGDRNYSDRRK